MNDVNVAMRSNARQNGEFGVGDTVKPLLPGQIARRYLWKRAFKVGLGLGLGLLGAGLVRWLVGKI